jgi:chromosome condensin MukBEF ATPase and DNA-binding subunit MukB
LKNKVNQDEKAIAHLTISLEDQKMVVNQLNGRIVQLEASYANHSITIDKKVS